MREMLNALVKDYSCRTHKIAITTSNLMNTVILLND